MLVEAAGNLIIGPAPVYHPPCHHHKYKDKGKDKDKGNENDNHKDKDIDEDKDKDIESVLLQYIIALSSPPGSG